MHGNSYHATYTLIIPPSCNISYNINLLFISVARLFGKTKVLAMLFAGLDLYR